MKSGHEELGKWYYIRTCNIYGRAQTEEGFLLCKIQSRVEFFLESENPLCGASFVRRIDGMVNPFQENNLLSVFHEERIERIEEIEASIEHTSTSRENLGQYITFPLATASSVIWKKGRYSNA